MKWYYKEIFIDRDEAERRIKKLGFQNTNRGWELLFKDKTQRRLHIVPSIDYMEVHQDINGENKTHKVVKNAKAKYRCQNIINRLNYHSKIKVFFKRILSKL